MLIALSQDVVDALSWAAKTHREAAPFCGSRQLRCAHSKPQVFALSAEEVMNTSLKSLSGKIVAVGSLVALLGSAACENIALIKRPTPEIDGDEIVGEITAIDLRLRQIDMRITPSGASRAENRIIRLEQDTQVLYRGREYPISSLEVGDIVALQIRNRDRGSWTNLVRVEQGGKDRQARQSGAASQRIEGTIERIDSRTGTFELRERSGNNIRVSLAPNAESPVADQFTRLRRGDYVLAEGRFLSRDSFEADAIL
jgi:hypothetical protein